MDRSAEEWLASAEFLFVNSKTGTSVEEINTLTQGAFGSGNDWPADSGNREE